MVFLQKDGASALRVLTAQLEPIADHDAVLAALQTLKADAAQALLSGLPVSMGTTVF
jgi:hypothetical protein